MMCCMHATDGASNEVRFLTSAYPSLAPYGFIDRVADRFGLQICGRGDFGGCVFTPLFGPCNRLLAYALLKLAKESISIKYFVRFLPNGKVRHLDVPPDLLYPVASAHVRFHDIIIVQSIPAVWWLWQFGYDRSITPISSKLTPHQILKIKSLLTAGGKLCVMPNGNRSGDRFAEQILNQIGRGQTCRLLSLPAEATPMSLSSAELRALLK